MEKAECRLEKKHRPGSLNHSKLCDKLRLSKKLILAAVYLRVKLGVPNST